MKKKKNGIRSHNKQARLAGGILANPKASAKAKKLAGGVLVNHKQST